MSNVKIFLDMYYRHAKAVELKEGVPALFTLAQSALETGWGKTVVGNMMFGVKDTDGINGNEQLLTTTEYHKSPNVKYPVVIWVKRVGNLYKYRIKDWFRKYASPEESFRDHAIFLKKNPRYRGAFNYTRAPYLFAKEVCKAGYATDPNYQHSIEAIMRMIEKYI